jgi:hypothetical protein
MSTAAEPPMRVDEAPAQRVHERRWWPALAVAGLILALVVSGQRVGGDGSAPSPVTVGSVRVTPRPGWELDHAEPDGARLRRGSAVLDIFAAPSSYTGAQGVATSYVDRVLRPSLGELRLAEPASTTIAGGVPAVAIAYVGVTADGIAIEGVVLAANGTQTAAVFDAAAPEGTLAAVAEDVGAMIDHAVFVT